MQLIQMLEAIGVSFSVDWDGEVETFTPDTIQTDSVKKLISDNEKTILQQIEWRRCADRRVFVGGPLAGKKLWKYFYAAFAHHVGRAQWASYMIYDYQDGRAWFCGMATNKKKAIVLAVERRNAKLRTKTP